MLAIDVLTTMLALTIPSPGFAADGDYDCGDPKRIAPNNISFILWQLPNCKGMQMPVTQQSVVYDQSMDQQGSFSSICMTRALASHEQLDVSRAGPYNAESSEWCKCSVPASP